MITILKQLVQRTRQHHAIEHATIHLLSARNPRQSFSGLSDPLGFTLFGNVNAEEVRQSVSNAMLRMQSGEHNLAIHPNCGTNLATTGILVTLVAMAASSGKRTTFSQKFPLVLLLVLGALIAAVPLGFRLQAFTTSPQIHDRWLVDVQPIQVGQVVVHRVVFE